MRHCTVGGCTRKIVFDGHCVGHMPRTLVLETRLTVPPSHCPHCHAPPPGWSIDRDLGHCAYCGKIWERPMAVVGA